MKSIQQIRLLAFDVDGVLTDGMLYYGAAGEVMKGFSARDGMGISLARAGGLRTAILTGRLSPMVEARAKELQIDYVIQKAGQKLRALQELCQDQGLTLENVAYMGDDLNDVAVIEHVALGGSPADACQEAREAAAFVASCPGGHGALREFSEYILKGQQRWDAVLQRYLGGAGRLEQ